MRKTIKTIAFLSLFGITSLASYGQSGLKKSDAKYESWEYADARKLYKKVKKSGYKSKALLEKLGNTYYFNGMYSEAHLYYELLFAEYSTDGVDADYYYRYAHTLQSVGKTSEAKTYYNRYVEKVGGETQIAKIRKNESALESQIQSNSGRYRGLVNLPINTRWSDYGSYLHDNQLYFTSSRDTGSLVKKVHTWTGDSFSNLYRADISSSNEKDVKRLSGLRTTMNESSAVLTKDGQKMYFTRNNYKEGKRGYDEKGNTLLKIYRATYKDGNWTNIEELPFNSDSFNTAHPALSSDEKTLYFSSDRPGGYGSSDLWKVSINGDSFGVPQNLGPGLNTEARETFPFVSSKDELYFSSDGRVGLGGLDVYATKLRKDGSFGEVHNVGEPINSSSDDFAYYIDSKTKRGYVSSNREGGKGNDDIYSFVEERELTLECLQKLRVKVVDSKTGEQITDATVTLFDLNTSTTTASKGYSEGSYQLLSSYACGGSYRIKVDKTDYVGSEISVVLPNESGVTEKTISLTRKVVEVKPEPPKVKVVLKKGDDLFKKLELNPIFFDTNKHDIRPDAALELTKILNAMKEYPKMKVDVRSHTDSRASTKYNDDLSERRAKSTAEWLISNGIERSRLKWKGYGERQLLNKCKDGVQCTEEEHQANRRSEFIILDM